MSNTPYYLPKARGGLKYGHAEIVTELCVMVSQIIKTHQKPNPKSTSERFHISDHSGLSDAYDNSLMGICAELIASDLKLTREMQDDYAISSYHRAQNAQKNGFFDGEIVPVEIPGARGAKATVITVDEEASKVSDFPVLFSL